MTTVSFDPYDRNDRTEQERDRQKHGIQNHGKQVVPREGTPKSLEVEPMYEPAQTTQSAQMTSGLSERDQAILEFERQWWKYAGAKEQAIRELFNMSSTKYYQLINSLIDTPEALEFDPMLVKRLRRMRSSRQQARTAGRSASR